MSDGILVAIATVHRTIITSPMAPRPNAVTQTTASGATRPSISGESAKSPPADTTSSIGLRGVYRSEMTPPTIRPSTSAAEIAPPQEWGAARSHALLPAGVPPAPPQMGGAARPPMPPAVGQRKKRAAPHGG